MGGSIWRCRSLSAQWSGATLWSCSDSDDTDVILIVEGGSQRSQGFKWIKDKLQYNKIFILHILSLLEITPYFTTASVDKTVKDCKILNSFDLIFIDQLCLTLLILTNILESHILWGGGVSVWESYISAWGQQTAGSSSTRQHQRRPPQSLGLHSSLILSSTAATADCHSVAIKKSSVFRTC